MGTISTASMKEKNKDRTTNVLHVAMRYLEGKRSLVLCRLVFGVYMKNVPPWCYSIPYRINFEIKNTKIYLVICEFETIFVFYERIIGIFPTYEEAVNAFRPQDDGTVRIKEFTIL